MNPDRNGFGSGKEIGFVPRRLELGCAGWRAWVAVLVLIAVCGLLGGAGCATRPSDRDGEADPSLALSEENQYLARGCLSAVEIRGQSLVTVQETVESVFTGAGLGMTRRTEGELIFERPATRKELGAYGTWFVEEVRVRLRVTIEPQAGGVHFLRCRSYIARDSGTSAEDEQPLARRHVRKYESLLAEVSSRLN